MIQRKFSPARKSPQRLASAAKPHRSMIDALEPRQMLAVFTGTEGTDAMRVYVSNGVTHVVVNGNDQTTTDSTILINALGGTDVLHIDNVPLGLTVDMGSGADLVRYGANDQTVGASPNSATIIGGLGNDTITFNDRNGTTSSGYVLTGNSIYSQVISGFENGELTVRPNGVVQIGGTAQLNFFSIHGGTEFGNVMSVRVGEEAAPVDLDSINFSLTFNCRVTNLSIYDSDTNQSENPYHFWFSGGTQSISKGPFVASFGEFSDMQLFTGSTDETFNFAGMLFKSGLQITDSGGTNLVQTVNFAGLQNDNDLDGVFLNTFNPVVFTGGGDYVLDLDDSADQVGDGDEQYTIRGTSFSKGDRLFMTYPNASQVNLVADAGDNTIFIAGNTGGQQNLSKLTLDGGPGNDTFSISGGQFLQDIRGGGAIIGGPGIDRLDIIDSDPASTITSYGIESQKITWSGSPPFAIDGTLEALTLEQSPVSSVTTLHSKPAGLSILIDAGPGNDQFSVGGGDFDANGFAAANTTISGGAGTDSVTFNDSLDDGAAGATYTFGVFSLVKGTTGFSYNSFERQVLRPADATGQVPGSNTLNLNAVSGQIELTTITGGGNRPNIVNVGNGQIPNIGLAVNFSAAGGTINFNDQNTATARTYDIGANEMTSPVAVTFTSASAVNVNAGQGNDTFFIRGSSAATIVNGGIGNDVMTVGSGFGNYAAPVTTNGQVGTDTVRFNGTSETDLFVGTLRSNSFAASGITHPYAGFENVFVQTGGSGSDITIHSLVTLNPPDISSTTFAGGGGDDLIRFGTGNVVSTLTGNVSISGGGGNDTLIIDDLSNASARDYTFDQGNRFYRGTFTQVSVVRTSIERTILEATDGRNVITVDGSSSPLTIRANGGNDSVNVLDATSPVTVDTGPETPSTTAPFGDSLAINTDFATSGDTPATVIIDQSDTILGLTLAQSGILRIATGGVLDKSTETGSSLTLNGTLDLAGGAFLSRAGGPTPAQFRNQIITGRNAGAWNGVSASGAINSSLASGSSAGDGVGYGLGAELGIGSIGGFTITPGDTLLRYTLDGDADLDGSVNIADFSRLAANFNQTNRIWTTGDSNYDGNTNIGDFSLLAGNFNQSTASPHVARGAFAAVFGARQIEPTRKPIDPIIP